MKIVLSPYLAFPGQARQAMEFYKSVFGGELDIKTMGDFGYTQDEEEINLVMHSMLNNGDIRFMASDGTKSHPVNMGDNVSMSLSGDNEELLTTYFNKLSEGGRIDMPLEKQVWQDTFGMLTDKFGIHWMINITKAS